MHAKSIPIGLPARGKVVEYAPIGQDRKMLRARANTGESALEKINRKEELVCETGAGVAELGQPAYEGYMRGTQDPVP